MRNLTVVVDAEERRGERKLYRDAGWGKDKADTNSLEEDKTRKKNACVDNIYIYSKSGERKKFCE